METDRKSSPADRRQTMEGMDRERKADGMKIKICGMRRPEDIGYANQVLPDYVGFILAKGFRRSVSRETAAALKAQLDPRIRAVGVFVDDPLEEIISLLEEGVIDLAQLHGQESEEDILYLKAMTGKPVIKTVKAENRHIVEAWLDTAADYLLFDSGTGSGKTFDWSILEDIQRDFFLAGGLTPENLREAASQVQPYGVDLSSGTETDGVKDPEKMRRAVEIVRGL